VQRLIGQEKAADAGHGGCPFGVGPAFCSVDDPIEQTKNI